MMNAQIGALCPLQHNPMAGCICLVELGFGAASEILELRNVLSEAHLGSPISLSVTSHDFSRGRGADALLGGPDYLKGSLLLLPVGLLDDDGLRVDRQARSWKTDPLMECAPAGGQDQAAVLTVCRAC